MLLLSTCNEVAIFSASPSPLSSSLPTFPIAAKQAKAGKKMSKGEKPVKEAYLNMDVCVGANYLKTGEDPIIKPESEYPEWLWGLLDKQEPSADSIQYWRRLRKDEARKANAASKEGR